MSDNEPVDPIDNPNDTAPRGPLPSRSWFRALLRFWRLSRRSGPPTRSPLPTLLALSASWLILWIGIDWWERQPAPSFAAEGIPLLGWYALGALVLAAVLRVRSNPAPSFAATLVLVLGLVPLWLLLANFAAALLGPRGFWYAAVAVGLYTLLYLARGLHALTGRSQRLAAAFGTVFLAIFFVLSDQTNAIPDVFNPADAVATISDEELAERETALFEQADRIDTALEAVQRDASSQAEAFFLGFAGVGDEKVFAQEIGLASRVIGERYKTGERQISLINDERDLESAPLASVSGLTYALQGIASHMQLDRDVLFLALSSHGSSDPAVAVSNSDFPLTDLSPEDLADALRQAGIQWRVILISACYAGGFIEPLRDPHTIIITAAAADRTSFGCSSDSDLTYFGEALYRDALPEAGSLREAFDKAKIAIAEREKAEGETPSEPQAYFGFDVDTHLAGSLRGAVGPVTHLR